MKTNKFLLGGIAAAVTFFFLGWLIYGILLMDYMQNHYDQSLMKAEEDMIWWAMIVSNLASGFLLAFIICWANIKSLSDAALKGGIVGLLIALAINLSYFSMSDMILSFTPVIVDTFVSGFLWAVSGAVIFWVSGMGKKKE